MDSSSATRDCSGPWSTPSIYLTELPRIMAPLDRVAGRPYPSGADIQPLTTQSLNTTVEEVHDAYSAATGLQTIRPRACPALADASPITRRPDHRRPGESLGMPGARLDVDSGQRGDAGRRGDCASRVPTWRWESHGLRRRLTDRCFRGDGGGVESGIPDALDCLQLRRFAGAGDAASGGSPGGCVRLGQRRPDASRARRRTHHGRTSDLRR